MRAISDWAYVVVAIGSSLGMVWGFVRYLIRSYLRELVPNGGNSMADRVRRIEDNQTRIHERIDAIWERLGG